MAVSEHDLSSRGSWLSAPEAGEALGVHRTAISTMIRTGRLPATRVGPHWRIPVRAFRDFQATYTRPPNVPVPVRDPEALPPIAERVLEWLYRWGTATTAELGEVLDDDPGNIRKGTTILARRGLATKDEDRVWELTVAGVEFACRRGVPLEP
jgi:excisionase family DNA binding protein